MKKTPRIILAGFAFAIPVVSDAAFFGPPKSDLSIPTDFVFVQSSDRAEGDRFEEIVIKTVFDYLDPGHHLTIIDGSDAAEITRFVMPENIKYDSAPKRNQIFQNALREYQQWLEATTRKGTYELDIPRTLEILAARVNAPTQVLIYGDIVHRRGPYSFSQTDEAGNAVLTFPNDNMLLLEGEYPWKSTYQSGNLKHMRLHFLYPRHLDIHPDYADRIKRFYTLWALKQESGVYAFSNDQPPVVRTLYDLNAKHFNYAFELSENGPGMVVFNPARQSGVKLITNPDKAVDLPRPTIRDFEHRNAKDVQAGNGSQNRSNLYTSVAKMLSADTLNGEISIAIGWDGNQQLDFDLVIVPAEGAEPLYHSNRTSEYGTYLRDRRTSEQFLYEETVLKSIQPGIEIWVNLHEVRGIPAGPPNGEYLIAADGLIWSGKFSFHSRRGNLGEGYSNRANSVFWTKLDGSMLYAKESSLVKKTIH